MRVKAEDKEDEGSTAGGLIVLIDKAPAQLALRIAYAAALHSRTSTDGRGGCTHATLISTGARLEV